MPTMHLRLLPLLAALLAAGPAFAGPPGKEAEDDHAEEDLAREVPAPAEAEDDFSRPPPGTPADQALWATGRRAGTSIRGCRAEASRLARFTRHNRLEDRLTAAAQASPEQAAALDQLRQRLRARWKENFALLSRRWPIDVVRGCHAQLLLFESALHAKAAKGPRPGVEQAREDVKACVEKTDLVVRQMTEANSAFGATIDEVVRRLAELEPPRAPAAGPAAPPARPGPPAPEASKG